jgi:hypothetical protein
LVEALPFLRKVSFVSPSSSFPNLSAINKLPRLLDLIFRSIQLQNIE